MRIVADFHIHSPYARAVSKEMTLENLDYWARLKGITVMGTGDFTHPQWIKEIKTKLEPAEPGLYVLKAQNTEHKLQTKHRTQNTNAQTRFMLTVEISSIYSKNGKTRRVHNLIFAPSIEAVEKINAALGWQGNLKSDGRPILGLGSKELAKIVLNIDERCLIVPAHAYTPWFSVFGSMSGFDSLEECFDEYAKYIYAIESGLSSDPPMSWRNSRLDHVAIISNSDSHSLQKIGREANIFDTELSYDKIVEAIKSHDPRKFLYTIEFFPEEGKYHYDGHRLCKFSCAPAETKKMNKICPRCNKPLTVGVMNRADELADRPVGGKPEVEIPFKSMVPLDEIIAEAYDMGVTAKKVKETYCDLIEKIGDEFTVLVDTTQADFDNATAPEVVEGIMRVRKGELQIEPGYDGEYGKVKIFEEGERKEISKQNTLF